MARARVASQPPRPPRASEHPASTDQEPQLTLLSPPSPVERGVRGEAWRRWGSYRALSGCSQRPRASDQIYVPHPTKCKVLKATCVTPDT